MNRVRLVVFAAVLLLGGSCASAARPGETPLGAWTLTDLGTLGGPYSKALGVNDRGQVVGISTIVPGERRPSKLIWKPFVWESGKMRALPTSGTTEFDEVGYEPHELTIDNCGQVISALGALWENGRLVPVPVLPGFDYSMAEAANDSGMVAGTSCVKGTHGPCRAFVLRNGKLTELATLGGSRTSWPIAVNDRGQVLGWSRRGEGSPSFFVWQNGTIRLIRLPPGPLAINDRSQVMGGGALKSEWIWDAGTVTKFKGMSQPIAINTRGQIVGTDYASLRSRALVWQKGKLIDLGTLGGTGPWSEAAGINDRGQIVANSYTQTWTPTGQPKPRAFVWVAGKQFRLPGLAGDEPSRISAATAINAAGQIVGWSNTGERGRGPTDPPFHAVLWTPR